VDALVAKPIRYCP